MAAVMTAAAALAARQAAGRQGCRTAAAAAAGAGGGRWWHPGLATPPPPPPTSRAPIPLTVCRSAASLWYCPAAAAAASTATAAARVPAARVAAAAGRPPWQPAGDYDPPGAYPVWHWLADALGEVPSGLAAVLSADTFGAATRVARDSRAAYPFAAMLPLMIARQLPRAGQRRAAYETLAAGDLLCVCASSLRRYAREFGSAGGGDGGDGRGGLSGAGDAIPRFYVRGTARCLIECCVLLARQRHLAPLRLQLAAQEFAEEAAHLLVAACSGHGGAPLSVPVAVDVLYFWGAAAATSTMRPHPALLRAVLTHCGLRGDSGGGGDGGGAPAAGAAAAAALPDLALARLVAACGTLPPATAASHAPPAVVASLADIVATRLAAEVAGTPHFLRSPPGPPGPGTQATGQAGRVPAAAASGVRDGGARPLSPAAEARAVLYRTPTPLPGSAPDEPSVDALEVAVGVDALHLVLAGFTALGLPHTHAVWRAAAAAMLVHPAAATASKLTTLDAVVAMLHAAGAAPPGFLDTVSGGGAAAPLQPARLTAARPSTASSVTATPPAAATAGNHPGLAASGGWEGGEEDDDGGDAAAAARLLHAAAASGGSSSGRRAPIAAWLQRAGAAIRRFPRLDRGDQLVGAHAMLAVAALTAHAATRLGVVDVRLARALDAALPTALQALREHPLLPADAVSLYGSLLRGLAPLPLAGDALAAAAAALGREASTSDVWRTAHAAELVAWLACLAACDACSDALLVRVLRAIDASLPQLPARHMARLLYALHVSGGLARGKGAHTARFLLRSLRGMADRQAVDLASLHVQARAAIAESCAAVLCLPAGDALPPVTAHAHSAAGDSGGGGGAKPGSVVHPSLKVDGAMADAAALRTACLVGSFAGSPPQAVWDGSGGGPQALPPDLLAGGWIADPATRVVTLTAAAAAAYLPRRLSALPSTVSPSLLHAAYALPTPLHPGIAMLAADDSSSAPGGDAGRTLPPLPPALLSSSALLPPLRARMHLFRAAGWTPAIVVTGGDATAERRPQNGPPG